MPLKQDLLNNGPLSPPMTKRQRLQSPTGSIKKILIPMGAKKCGEVLVTNNADKWTFVCTFCKLVTGDIGVFICHIKTKHLHGEEQLQNDFDDVTANNDTANNDVNLGQHKQLQNFPAIIDVSSLAEKQINERSSNEQLRCSLSSPNSPEESILPHYSEDQSEQRASTSLLQSKEVYEVIYLNDDDNKKSKAEEENNCITIDDDDDDDQKDNENNVVNEALDSNTQFYFSLNSESSNDDLEFIEDINEDSVLVPTGYNSNRYSTANSHRSGTADKKNINEQDLPFKCSYCSKSFKSKQAINYHHKTHEKQNQLKCPMCPLSHCTEHLFISHVLTHETSTCFPCQVCGQALPTNEKRLEHMKSHLVERPYGCTFCCRRFRKKHHLTNHLRLHCQYLCDFCPAAFIAERMQRRPYVCPSCEHSPIIRKKVEYHRSLGAKNHSVELDQE